MKIKSINSIVLMNTADRAACKSNNKSLIKSMSILIDKYKFDEITIDDIRNSEVYKQIKLILNL